MRSALSAVLAPAPAGFTTAHFRDKVQSMTGLSDSDYTPREAAYDLKKLRAKDLISKVRHSRRYAAPFPEELPQRLIQLYSWRGDVMAIRSSGAARPLQSPPAWAGESARWTEPQRMSSSHAYGLLVSGGNVWIDPT
jgi:hypothetical protein